LEYLSFNARTAEGSSVSEAFFSRTGHELSEGRWLCLDTEDARFDEEVGLLVHVSIEGM
jgi:hypothetical protein